MILQPDPDEGGAGVTDRIGDRFLSDPEQRLFNRRRHRRYFLPARLHRHTAMDHSFRTRPQRVE